MRAVVSRLDRCARHDRSRCTKSLAKQCACGHDVARLGVALNESEVIHRCGTLLHESSSDTFTNDREKLPAALGHGVSRESAHTPQHKQEQEQSIQPPQQEIAPKQEHSYGMGLGL